MMALKHLHNIEDLRQAAHTYLPRLVWDYFEGGAEDEQCLQRNRAAYAAIELLPNYLVDVSAPDTRTTLFGHSWRSCFGIAPMGLQGFARAGADLMLARAAAARGIPFVLSGAGTASIEAVCAACEHAWFQLYVARDQAVTRDLVRRARDSGVEVLVLTVDAPVHSKRERDLRNGFVPPPRIRWPLLLEMLQHPAWCLDKLRHGLPRFENWAPYAGADASAQAIADYFSRQIPFTQTWQDLAELRHEWPGRLVLKGLLSAADAQRAAAVGVDALILSNHGGRVLDSAPSPLHQLALVRAAVGADMPLMLDSGLRRGSDIVKALALGADFVWIGRPALYGVAAHGQAGAERAIEVLQEELELTLAQIGRPCVSTLASAGELLCGR